MADKVQKIRKEVERLMYGFNLEADIASCEDAETEKLSDIKYQLCKKILGYIDKVQEEPVIEGLDEASRNYADNEEYGDEVYFAIVSAFKAGAKWKKVFELTWEDMMLIHKCIKDAMNYHLYKMLEGADGQKVVYEEVLNRFNKLKAKEG